MYWTEAGPLTLEQAISNVAETLVESKKADRALEEAERKANIAQNHHYGARLILDDMMESEADKRNAG